VLHFACIEVLRGLGRKCFAYFFFFPTASEVRNLHWPRFVSSVKGHLSLLASKAL
jgi:hypothetical protein